MGKNADILNSHFYDEKGNAIGLPDQFRYDEIKFGDYEIKEHMGELYAIAKKPLKKVNGKYQEVNMQPNIVEEIKEIVVCKKGELLFSMLSLIDKLSDSSLESDYKYTQKDIKLIITWCKKYGLPFFGKPLKLDTPSTTELAKENLIGFSVKSFLILINEIKYLFLYYQRIKNIDNPENVFSSLDRNSCMFLMQRFTESFSFKSYIDFDKGLYIKIYAENLILACIYILLLYLSSPKNLVMKRCDCCNAFFMPLRSNNKYCNQCSPQKAYAYKKRHGLC